MNLVYLLYLYLSKRRNELYYNFKVYGEKHCKGNKIADLLIYFH